MNEKTKAAMFSLNDELNSFCDTHPMITVRRSDLETALRGLAKLVDKPSGQAAGLKLSISTYCGECHEDFKPGEIVFFTWTENRSFCGECYVKLKPKIRDEDWEPRKIPEGDEEA